MTTPLPPDAELASGQPIRSAHLRAIRDYSNEQRDLAAASASQAASSATAASGSASQAATSASQAATSAQQVSNKADLVNGKVPEGQLPDGLAASRRGALGLAAKVGQYITPMGSGNVVSNGVGVLGFYRAIPLALPRDVRVDGSRIQINTGAAGATIRLGIYASDVDGSPSTLIRDIGSIDAATSNAIVDVAFSPTLLPAGTVWLVSVQQGSALATTNGTNFTPHTTGSAAVAAVASCLQASSASIPGAMPATLPPADPNTTSTGPRLLLKVAA